MATFMTKVDEETKILSCLWLVFWKENPFKNTTTFGKQGQRWGTSSSSFDENEITKRCRGGRTIFLG